MRSTKTDDQKKFMIRFLLLQNLEESLRVAVGQSDGCDRSGDAVQGGVGDPGAVVEIYGGGDAKAEVGAGGIKMSWRYVE